MVMSIRSGGLALMALSDWLSLAFEIPLRQMDFA